MKKPLREERPHIRMGMPDIYDGGIAGFLFLCAIVVLCLRLPQTIPFVLASVILGLVVAFFLWLRRR